MTCSLLDITVQLYTEDCDWTPMTVQLYYVYMYRPCFLFNRSVRQFTVDTKTTSSRNFCALSPQLYYSTS